jgi:hypothetical protein
MSDALNVLVLDDDDPYLNEIFERVRRIWQHANIERCSSAKEAIEKVSRSAVDVAVLDLNMDKDLNTEWPAGTELNVSGGFTVYFSINSYRWGLLPPIIVLYTANPDLKGPLAPFMYRGSEEYLRGRPFIITTKEDTGKIMLEEALLDQEFTRFRAYSHKLYDFEEVISSLEGLISINDPNSPIEDWFRIGEIEVGPKLCFKQVFPTAWHMAVNMWDHDYIQRDNLFETIRDLLAERRWLPNLNSAFDKNTDGDRVIHYSGDGLRWAKLAEKVKSLPLVTRAHLLSDLNADSWEAPPWVDENDYIMRWCPATEFQFKSKWRVWDAPDVVDDRKKDGTAKSITLVGIVNKKLNSNTGATVKWVGAYSSTGEELPPVYMDPYILAETVNRVFAGEIIRRAVEGPHAWLRVVYRCDEADGGGTMAMDLIAHGTKGFAEKLRAKAKDSSSRYRSLAAELSGWCELWLYTHDENDRASVIGLNMSNPTAPEQRGWPDDGSGDIPWDEVGCVVRWLFHIPPVSEPRCDD